jgi:kinesin family protein 6/9
VESLRQVRELFVQFKNIYRSAVKDIENNSFVQKDKETKEKVEDKAQVKDMTGKVGVEETNFGFGAGKAAKDAKPSKNISNLVHIPRD